MDGDRLKKSRQYRHGLSRPPSPSSLRPQGDRALLPCPLEGQGTCGYRSEYGCTEVVQTHSRGLGHCAIEAAELDRFVEHAARCMGCRSVEEVPEGLRPAIRAWAEAAVYHHRALLRLGRRMVDEVATPSPQNALRYLTAGSNARVRREQALIEEALRVQGEMRRS